MVRFHKQTSSLVWGEDERKNSFVCSDEFIDKLQPLAQKSEGDFWDIKVRIDVLSTSSDFYRIGGTCYDKHVVSTIAILSAISFVLVC